jgi:hypothetical protein
MTKITLRPGQCLSMVPPLRSIPENRASLNAPVSQPITPAGDESPGPRSLEQRVLPKRTRRDRPDRGKPPLRPGPGTSKTSKDVRFKNLTTIPETSRVSVDVNGQVVSVKLPRAKVDGNLMQGQLRPAEDACRNNVARHERMEGAIRAYVERTQANAEATQQANAEPQRTQTFFSSDRGQDQSVVNAQRPRRRLSNE